MSDVKGTPLVSEYKVVHMEKMLAPDSWEMWFICGKGEKAVSEMRNKTVIVVQ